MCTQILHCLFLSWSYIKLGNQTFESSNIKRIYTRRRKMCVCVYLRCTCIVCVYMYVGTYVMQCMYTCVYECGSLRLMLWGFLYHSQHFYWGLVSCWTQSSSVPARLASQLALGSPISTSQALGLQASTMPTWSFMPFPGSLPTELFPQAQEEIFRRN